MNSHAVLNTGLGVFIQLAVIFWIIGLLVSLLCKDANKYLNFSKKHIGGFIKKYWRYIVVFLLGYLSGYPGSLHFTVQ